MGVTTSARAAVARFIETMSSSARGWLPRARDYVMAHRDLRSILLAWTAVYLLFGEGIGFRAHIDGGRGLVPVGTAITIGLAVYVLSSGAPLRRHLARVSLRRMPFVIAYLLLDAGFSIAGVAIGGPFHLLAAVLQPLNVAAWAVIGAAIVSLGSETFVEDVTKLLVGVGVVQAAVGFVQVVSGYTGIGLVLVPWMNHLASIHEGQVFSRASGLYLGANAYSLFGALLFAWGAFAGGTRRQRLTLVIAGVLIVVLGSSRSALIALVVLGVVWLVANRSSLRRPSRSTALTAVAGAGLASTLIALSPFGRRLVDRVMSVVNGLIGVTPTDRDVGARFDGWRVVLDFVREHPLGTLTPPNRVIGLIDSDYMYVLAKGGGLLLAGFLTALLDLLVQARRSIVPAAMRAFVLVVALTGLSQYSSGYVPTLATLWLLAGTALWDHPTVDGPSTSGEEA